MYYKFYHGYLANCTANLTLTNTSSVGTFYSTYYTCNYGSAFNY